MPHTQKSAAWNLFEMYNYHYSIGMEIISQKKLKQLKSSGTAVLVPVAHQSETFQSSLRYVFPFYPLF